MRKLTRGAALIAAIALCGGLGCEAVERVAAGSSEVKEGDFVQVNVPRPDEEGTVPVVVEKNKGDASHESAISRMQVDEFASAAQLLEAGLADNKPVREAGSSDRQKYMREHLALAVCYEMLGRDEEAREQYVLANDCKSDSRAQEGARRCAEKLGL